MDWFPTFVQKYLAYTGKCYRHCDRPTTLRVISQNSEHVLGAYTCPDGVVSHVVYLSPRPNVAWFEDTLSDQLGKQNVEGRDVRLASRHGWELGEGAREELVRELGDAGSITEVYWRRYPQSDEQKQMLVSMCIGNGIKPGCLRLFMQSEKSGERLCPACRAKET